MTKTFSDHGIDIEGVDKGEARAKCPQCADQRKKHWLKTLAVNVDEGMWYCHHCGWSGSLGGDQSQEQVKRKIKRPVWIPEKLEDMPPQAYTWLVRKRGLSQGTLRSNMITARPEWMPGGEKLAIQFPYTVNGLVVNVKYRTLDKEFRQIKGGMKCFYRHDDLMHCQEKDMPLVITEGELDALALVESGIQTATSVPDGAPSSESQNFQTKFDFLKNSDAVLKKFQKVVICVDTDGPGKILEAELVRRIGVERCFKAEMPKDCKDANDVLLRHGKAAVRRLALEAKPYPVSGLIAARDALPEVEYLYQNGVDRGVSTGWLTLDKLYTVKVGEMTIVTGIPASGKSNFLDALTVNIAKSHNWSFAVFSPENWPVQRHITTLLEKIEKKPFWNNRYASRMSPDDMSHGMQWLNDHFHFIIPEEETMSVDTILEKTRAAILRHGVRGVIIDPWNEIEHDMRYAEREDQYISRALTQIRRFARFNGVHIWVVAHPKNLQKDKTTGKYKAPTMYEISGGAHWRNKADNGICVHRPDLQKSEVDIIVQKIRYREVGRPGVETLVFASDTGTYIVPRN